MTPYAFPRPLPNVAVPPDEALAIWERHSGMTLRDYFAAQAVQGEVASLVLGETLLKLNPSEIAETAYSIADAMLKAREA